MPAATEMLFAIGAGPRVIAVSSYDHEPPEVDRLPRVGALLDPDLERILSLRADLVVAYGTQHELKQQLARATIPVFAYTHGGLAEVTATIRALGERTGATVRAAAVATASKATWRPSGRKWLAGHAPGRCWCSGGNQARCAISTRAAASASCMTCSKSPERPTSFPEKRESVQASSETLLAMAPEVIIELHVESDGPVDLSAWQTPCRRCPP